MPEDQDDGATPRQTYMPKPPSKEEVDQVSREQAMISDEWTGEPSAEPSTGGGAAAPENEQPPREKGEA
jgi:hypothetical protein